MSFEDHKVIVTRGSERVQLIAEIDAVELHGHGMGSLAVRTRFAALDAVKILQDIRQRRDVASVDASPIFATEHAVVSSLSIGDSRDGERYALCVEFRVIKTDRPRRRAASTDVDDPSSLPIEFHCACGAKWPNPKARHPVGEWRQLVNVSAPRVCAECRSPTSIGRAQAVRELEQDGSITAEEAGGLLEMPQCDLPRPLPSDPLDAIIDGIALGNLLVCDETLRREQLPAHRRLTRAVLTPDQRVAVSAHWSAELHARIEKARTADLEQRPQVVLDCAEEL